MLPGYGPRVLDPIVRPTRPGRVVAWLLLPCLFLADLSNTALAALLTFSDQPLYAYYAEGPRLGNLSPLDDQAAAGILMWVPGSWRTWCPLRDRHPVPLWPESKRRTRRPWSSLLAQPLVDFPRSVWPATHRLAIMPVRGAHRL